MLSFDQHITKYKLISSGVKMTGLRKARSRMIADALIKGEAVRGNHKVRYTPAMDTIDFLYRDTPIMVFFIEAKEIHTIPTDYEHTQATENQRNLARLAIQEVFGV